MREIPPKRREGFYRKCWKLAERLESVATDVRYANKPADLTFPKFSLLDLAGNLNELRGEWLEAILKLNPEERGRWPKL